MADPNECEPAREWFAAAGLLTIDALAITHAVSSSNYSYLPWIIGFTTVALVVVLVLIKEINSLLSTSTRFCYIIIIVCSILGVACWDWMARIIAGHERSLRERDAMDSIVFLEKIAWNMYCSFTAMGLLLYVAPFSFFQYWRTAAGVSLHKEEPLIIKRAPFDKKAIISILVIVVMKISIVSYYYYSDSLFVPRRIGAVTVGILFFILTDEIGSMRASLAPFNKNILHVLNSIMVSIGIALFAMQLGLLGFYSREDIYSDAALGIVTMTQMFLLMLYFHFTAAKEEQLSMIIVDSYQEDKLKAECSKSSPTLSSKIHDQKKVVLKKESKNEETEQEPLIYSL